MAFEKQAIPSYCPSKLEIQIQQDWEARGIFKANSDSNKPHYFCLAMFPYPSGKLHMGHVRNYTLVDVIARYQRLRGKEVLHPLGWDAFGLPAENAAITNKTTPQTWTDSNIAAMKKQLIRMGLSVDWDRELFTNRPDYYRWQQWLFNRLYQKGLVYRDAKNLNWCPNDKTILANEQVIDERCWRCDGLVEQKSFRQWFLALSKYAEPLLNGLDDLPEWSTKVKEMQKNWIGKQKGLEIQMKLSDGTELSVFTERTELLLATSYIALSEEHPLVLALKAMDPAVAEFVQTLEQTRKHRHELLSLSYRLPLTAKHPLFEVALPILITADFIELNRYKAALGVPDVYVNQLPTAQAARLEVKNLLQPDESKNKPDEEKLIESSLLYAGFTVLQARVQVEQTLLAQQTAKAVTTYRLNDWCVSRQRYWGSPIPMAKHSNGDWVAIPNEQLPVVLPISNSLEQNPLLTDTLWREVWINGERHERDPETFDTFVDSSWYYARYTCPHYEAGMLDPEQTARWLPVDHYIGGIEHATMHLLYFRFFHKLLKEEGLVQCDEPVKRLTCQGMVLADAFYRKLPDGTIEWITPTSLDIKKDKKTGTLAASYQGLPVTHAGMCKMSKSKANGLDPDALIEQYGVDTIRLFILFAAPPEADLAWSPEGVEGCSRFLHRLWRLAHEVQALCNDQVVTIVMPTTLSRHIELKTNRLLTKMYQELESRFVLNTAVAACMQYLNELTHWVQDRQVPPEVLRTSLKTLLVMLYPMVPHITAKLWTVLEGDGTIDTVTWPVPKAITLKSGPLVIQLNGKKCIVLDAVSFSISKTEALTMALKDNQVQAALKGRSPSKVIYKSGKILNLVLT